VLASRAAQNDLACDFVLTAAPAGRSFVSTDLNDQTGSNLSRHLIRLHRTKRSRLVSIAGLHRSIADTQAGALEAARSGGESSISALAELILELHAYIDAHATLFRTRQSLLHNDVWWDNIIVTPNDVYLIDWEWMSTGDYLVDISYARVMLMFRPVHNHAREFWQGLPDESVANQFFTKLVASHRLEFGDSTINERLPFYLALQTLRRLSDYAAGTYGVLPPLRDYWLHTLPKFWRHGLDW
jgi:aminoglycoside phosphotransferase (APT) family kinase protein